MRHDMGCPSTAVSHDIRLFGTSVLLVAQSRGTLALTSRAACMSLTARHACNVCPNCACRKHADNEGGGLRRGGGGSLKKRLPVRVACGMPWSLPAPAFCFHVVMIMALFCGIQGAHPSIHACRCLSASGCTAASTEGIVNALKRMPSPIQSGDRKRDAR